MNVDSDANRAFYLEAIFELIARYGPNIENLDTIVSWTHDLPYYGRETEQRVVAVFADMTKYAGSVSDSIWNDIDNDYRLWEVRAISSDAAYLKLGVNRYGFIWTRPGSSSYGETDEQLGLDRRLVNDSGTYAAEPGASARLAADIGSFPTKVIVGDTIAIHPVFAAAPWKVLFDWDIQCNGKAARDFLSSSSSYMTTAADTGCGVEVMAYASKAGFAPVALDTYTALGENFIEVGSSTSSKSFAKTHAPTVSGTAKVGKTLTASVKTWSPKATTRKWQWRRNGAAMTGATKSTYKLVAADLGKIITVALTGSKSGYYTATKVSKATKAVALGTLARGKVKITGTTRVGKTLTAKTSKWSRGVTYHYQWYRNSIVLDVATSKTYVLTVDDAAARLSVKVWTTRDGYKTSASRTSAKTGKIKS